MSETATKNEPTVAEMRAWLREHRPDIKVGDRGFLSQDAVAAYREAHAPAVTG